MQAWGYEIKGEMEFRYYDAAEPFVLTFSIDGSGAASAAMSPHTIPIPAQIPHSVHFKLCYSVDGSTLNITLNFSDPVIK